MKHCLKNEAVVAFKSQVDLMADYLAAAGYDIKRTHLVEAGARFKGAHDWRTLRAELASKPVPQKMSVPDLGRKSVRVYMEVHSCGEYGDSPNFCWTDIDQRWVNRVFGLRELGIEKRLSTIEDDNEVPDWMDDFGTYRIRSDSIQVNSGHFWYRGWPKHDSDAIETDMFAIDKVIKLVQNSTRAELYLFSDLFSVDGLMDALSRNEDDANFVSSDDENCVPDSDEFN